jgi:hypothetical protein
VDRDDTVYGSNGVHGPAPFTAIEAKTGNVLWKDRTFPAATFLYADGKLIAVDEDGNLSLATVSTRRTEGGVSRATGAA